MSWNKVRLGDVLTESKVESDISDPDKRITVRLNLKGVEKRPYEAGIEGATKYFVRKAGQFIYGKQNLFKGAFGIIPNELDGFESSSDIPTFDVSKGCLPEWLFYFLKQGDFYLSLESIATGTGSRRIQPARLFEVEIPLPSINEQKRIIGKCSITEKNYDKIVNELKLQQTHLQQLRQAILQEAVQGKLTKQNKDDESAEKLLQRIKAEKQKLIAAGKLKKEKELPSTTEDKMPFELPRGWVWCRLGAIALSISTGPFGTMLHKSDYIENGIPLVNPMNIVDGKIIPSQKMTINRATKDRLKNYLLEKGDIVLARRGEMGRCAVVTGNEQDWLCGTGSFFIRLSSYIDRSFFIKVFTSTYCIEYLINSSVGSTMNNLNHTILNSFYFPLPPLSEQQRIVSKVQKLQQIVNELEQKVAHSQTHAQQLLQAVLKEAFTSKAKVYEENELITMAAEE